MTDEPKALVVPPIPEWTEDGPYSGYPGLKSQLKGTQDWGRQGWSEAQAQSQRADVIQATLLARGSIYITDGHGALWGTAESITWVTDELDRLESTLAQRDREVLGLRQALRGHCQCESSDGLCPACEALAATPQAGEEVEQRILEAAWKRIRPVLNGIDQSEIQNEDG